MPFFSFFTGTVPMGRRCISESTPGPYIFKSAVPQGCLRLEMSRPVTRVQPLFLPGEVARSTLPAVQCSACLTFSPPVLSRDSVLARFHPRLSLPSMAINRS